MDKVLTTALLTIAAIVAAVMVVNAILPAVSTGTTSLISTTRRTETLLKTAIEIIHATRTNDDVRFWVKNVGGEEIQDIENADVFVEGSGGYHRMEFSASTPPTDCPGKWSYDYEDNNDSWTPSTTVKITVCDGSSTSIRVHFTTANGVTDKALIDG